MKYSLWSNGYHIQWNLYYPTPQGTKDMCRIVEDVGILRFHFRQRKYFGTINVCRMSQDVWNLRCWIAHVPLYYCRHDLKYRKNMIDETFTWLIDWCLMPTLSVFQLYRGIMTLWIWWVKDEIWISGHFTSVQNMRLSWHDVQKYMIFKHNRSFRHCWIDS